MVDYAHPRFLDLPTALHTYLQQQAAVPAPRQCSLSVRQGRLGVRTPPTTVPRCRQGAIGSPLHYSTAVI